MGYFEGFGVTIRQHRLFGGKRVTTNYSGGRTARRKGDDHNPEADDDQKAPKPERLHGRHVLNRYADGMEKCIGCELCAGVCPAKCIYVRGADNDVENPTSPGERFGFIYEINYLRCIHCDLWKPARPKPLPNQNCSNFHSPIAAMPSTRNRSYSSMTKAARSNSHGKIGVMAKSC